MKPAFFVWNVLACACASSMMVGGCALLADYDFGAYAERPPGAGGDSAQGGGGSGGDGGSASITTSGPGTGGGGGVGEGGSGGSGGGSGGGGGITVDVLYSGDAPKRIAVDEAHVYWTTAPSMAAVGTVERVHKRGGGHQVVAMNLDSPHHICADGMAVYWSTGYLDNAQIHRLEKTTGTTQTVYSFNEGLQDLAVWDQWLYFSHADVILKMPAAGATATGILSTSSPKIVGALAVDDTGVYWAENGAVNDYDSEIWKADLDGSLPTPLAVGQDYPYALAIDAGRVYWGTANGGVFSTRKDGTEEVLTHVASVNDPTLFVNALVTDGVHVYYTRSNQVLRTPIEEANPSLVLTYPQHPSSLAVDGSDLYVGTQGVTGKVLKLSNLPP